MDLDPYGWIAVVAGVLALGAIVLQVVVLRALAAHRAARDGGDGGEAADVEEPGPLVRPLPAVVVNPTKLADGAGTRVAIERACREMSWLEPLWFETTPEEHGASQTRQALAAGANLVLACGGDGTVRSVAGALAHSGVPMGLLPVGTGNLLARNLDINVTDQEQAVRIALTGRDRSIDVGRVTIEAPDGTVVSQDEVFLVMAGLGFDAAVMASTPEALKARVGWVAYVLSGFRLLKGRSSRVSLQVGDGPEIVRRLRTVVVGNCGRLLGGIVLMPDARVDDGWLDLVAIAPRGIVGWTAVLGQVVTRARRGHGIVEHYRSRTFTVRTDDVEQAQIDGDPVGDARSLRVSVDPDALLVRVPT